MGSVYACMSFLSALSSISDAVTGVCVICQSQWGQMELYRCVSGKHEGVHDSSVTNLETERSVTGSVISAGKPYEGCAECGFSPSSRSEIAQKRYRSCPEVMD